MNEQAVNEEREILSSFMLATRAARRVAAFGARRLHLPPLREQQPSDPVNFVRCLGCFKPITGTPLLCSACGSVSYCSPACQKKNWKMHKKVCKQLKAEREAARVAPARSSTF